MSATEHVPVAVLGSGMAAMGAAHTLREAGRGPVGFDARNYACGHTAMLAAGNGFLFDDGPHLSFMKDEDRRAPRHGRRRAIPHRSGRHRQRVAGRRIPHPVLNLHPLPPELVVAVLTDFVGQTTMPPGEIRSYADWPVASYGRTFAETFPMVDGR